MYRIKLTARAKKELKQIKKIYQESIKIAIDELIENPFLGKSLTRELTGRLSFRVGPCRIIYKVSEKNQIVTILTAGHRAIVYK